MDYQEAIKSITKLNMTQMLECGYITKEQYNEFKRLAIKFIPRMTSKIYARWKAVDIYSEGLIKPEIWNLIKYKTV